MLFETGKNQFPEHNIIYMESLGLVIQGLLVGLTLEQDIISPWHMGLLKWDTDSNLGQSRKIRDVWHVCKWSWTLESNGHKFLTTNSYAMICGQWLAIYVRFVVSHLRKITVSYPEKLNGLTDKQLCCLVVRISIWVMKMFANRTSVLAHLKWWLNKGPNFQNIHVKLATNYWLWYSKSCIRHRNISKYTYTYSNFF